MSRRSFSIVHQEGRVTDDLDTSTPWYRADHSTDNNDRTTEGMPEWEELSDAYVCERQEVSSHDGVEVPLTILYSREAWKKSESPGMLIGYGAYGEALDKSWCTNRLSMLDRGWVIAFADVRSVIKNISCDIMVFDMIIRVSCLASGEEEVVGIFHGTNQELDH